MEQLVEHGRTGLLFEPGDVDDLARTMALAWEQPDYMARLGDQAREEYEAKYTASANYRQLMEIYQRVIAKRSGIREAQIVAAPELPVV
jgi:glycosyltransferase involved in cell wall biosynthesis